MSYTRLVGCTEFILLTTSRDATLVHSAMNHVGQLVWHQRITLVVLGTSLLALLVTAAVLTPEPADWGTHQQLGLPPCTFRWMTGIACPACGMTTAWAHYVRGQIVQAVAANTGGTLLAIVATIAVPWSLISGCSGRQLGRQPLVYAVTAVVVIVAVALVEWISRLLLVFAQT